LFKPYGGDKGQRNVGKRGRLKRVTGDGHPCRARKNMRGVLGCVSKRKRGGDPGEYKKHFIDELQRDQTDGVVFATMEANES